ncbi:MAG: hypothetical protein JKY95_14945 [Planctomycetaceae bacterium]|nr:hypothetical protein [Planctomycetaceae bacterium]
MQRSVSRLLILLVLVGQSFCAAHSHAGTSVVEPEGHSARPHVHLHGVKHHCGQTSHRGHDGDGSREESLATPPDQEPVDHDSDALYISEAQLFHDTTRGQDVEVDLSVAGMVYDVSSTLVELRLCVERNSPPLLSGLKCPLYLQTLSIRC